MRSAFISRCLFLATRSNYQGSVRIPIQNFIGGVHTYSVQRLCLQARPTMLVVNDRCNQIQRRFKAKRGKKSEVEVNEEESDDEGPSDENPLLMDDTDSSDKAMETTILVSSTRLDSVVKSAMRVSRSRVEEAFYKGEIFINGERPNKKSDEIHVGDEVDLVKGVDAENHNMIMVKRAHILSFSDVTYEHGKMTMKVAIENDLSIPAPSLKSSSNVD